MKIFKQSILSKVVSLFLILAFSSYNVGFATTQGNTASIEEIKPADSELTIADSGISVNDIGVSIDSGTVKSTYNGTSDKIVIHIQDAHCNYEAQQNISRMLDQFVNECGVDMISVEGAEGIVDTSWFKAFPDAAIRNEVATYFTKKGEMTGAELFSITSDYKGTIFGAENRDDYVKNLKAFTKTYPYKKIIGNFFLNTRTVANRLKSIIYPPKLKELDLKIRAFDAKEIELSAFAAYLNKCLKRHDVPLKNYPNFEKLVDTLEYEGKIDFDIVDGERSRYIDLLGKKMSKEEMTELVAESIRFKKGHIKAVDFYTYLRNQAKEYNIPIVQEFPNLFYYYLYTKLYDGIDNEGLFKEIDEMQTALKDKLFTDETQEILDRHSEMIDMYVSLINIELTNGDYDLFKEYSSETSLEKIVDFLGRLSARYNLNYSVEGVPVQIGENIPNMVEFYEVAMERDRVLINNTIRQMDAQGKKMSVLITGGFHTRGMKDILEEKGISYVVVMPKITKDVETPYIQVLTNQRTSLEDILTDNAVPGAAGLSMPRAENTKAKGDILSPILKFGWGITRYLNPEERETLRALSRAMGKVEGGVTFLEKTVYTFEEAVRLLTEQWLEDVKDSMEKLGVSGVDEEWNEFLTDDIHWGLLLSVYLGKYEDYFRATKEGTTPSREVEGRIAAEFARFREEQRRETPGTYDAVGRVITEEQAKEVSEVLRKRIRSGRAYILDSEDKLKDLKDDVKREALKDLLLETGLYFVVHDNLIEELDKAGLPLNIHIGRGGEEKAHELLQVHIDRFIFDSLTKDELLRIAYHELAHFFLFNADEVAKPMERAERSVEDIEDAVKSRFKDRIKEEAYEIWNAWAAATWKGETKPHGEGQERFINTYNEKYNVRAEVSDRILTDTLEELVDEKLREIKEEREVLARQVPAHAEKMVEAAAGDIGPDIVIVTSSTDEQADFWQDRLTDDFGVRGTGVIVKKDAIVLSVPESNWEKGGAGNGLGTLNGFLQAARKAASDEFGLISVDEGLSGEEEITALIDAFMKFSLGQSVFMFHTAGKGTRTAPLPGAEVNSKSNIKLPRIVDVEGEPKEATILESVILQTSIYAPGRENRLSVFWGDQVIINEQEVKRDLKHHVEIFGMMVPLDREIEAYGVLIPGEEGDCKQREKLKLEEVRKLLPRGSREVYKSIGSFTISREFLNVMLKMPEHMQALVEEKGKLNTDPDWWQPLTSERNEYIQIMAEKDIEHEAAGAQWDKINSLWNAFTKSGEFSGSGLTRLLGSTDVGQHSFWWDYGQNKFFLRNMQILTEDSLEGEVARKFFSIGEDEWVKDSTIGKEVAVKNSVIQNSTIKRGKLINCVVINSHLEEVNAEGAVIIGSTVLRLNADGALCYNVVDNKVSLKKGQILVNIFHPELGRVAMRTNVSRDGQADWKGEVFVYDNLFTYGDIAEFMTRGWRGTKGVTVKDVEKMKQDAVKLLLAGQAEDLEPAGLAALLVSYRSLKAEELEVKAAELKNEGKEKEAKKVKEQTARARITLPEARQLIAKRMLMFGDVRDITIEDYMDKFEIAKTESNIEMASHEVKAIFAKAHAEKTIRAEYYREKFIPLRFGTSGLRGAVGDITNMEAYINTRGFLEYLIETRDIKRGDAISIAGDLRPSTRDIMVAVARAVEDSGSKVDLCGFLPTPALAYWGFVKERASIMVTGSHIPVFMNGIKFNKKGGNEVLKEDEQGINFRVKGIRDEEYSRSWEESPFDEKGMFKDKPVYELEAGYKEAKEAYVQRYLEAFPEDALKGKMIAFYQHSAVGRDIIQEIFESLGATIIPVQRSDDEEFVAVDTEKISRETREVLEKASDLEPFAIISTDGDSDRPLLADEKGRFLPGDKLGSLISVFLEPDFAAVPVSTNDAVIKDLKNRGIRVVQTKIGSPHVIKAMNDKLNEDPYARVVSWEANGGFLLGSDFDIPDGGTLKALPTRDAVLPLLAAMLLARRSNKSLSRLIRTEIPRRYNHADVFNGFEERFGKGRNKAIDLMKKVMKKLLPVLEDEKIISVNFEKGATLRLIDDTFEVEEKNIIELSSRDREEWNLLKERLEDIFTKSMGFEEIGAINILDGIKVRFKEVVDTVDGERAIIKHGEVSHLRPSGNAPEFRNYATAGTPGRAEEIVELGVDKIIPMLVGSVITEVPEISVSTPGIYSAQPGVEAQEYRKAMAKLSNMIKERKPLKTVPYFRTGADNYVWGQSVTKSRILEMMGAKAENPEEAEKKKIELAQKFGIMSAREVISERWITAGAIDVGTKYNLPPEVLSLFPNEVFGPEHVDQFGPESDITAKVLTSARPLSLQIHEFPEMIIPLKSGYAYMGLSRSVTQEEFIEALRKGDISAFNRIQVERGVPIIVPAGMPHAYGEVEVYEVKAVNAAQDKAGTISFYDRLRWELLEELEKQEAEALLKRILEAGSPEEAKIVTQELVAKGYIRDKKDVLTLTPEEVKQIARKIEDHGFLEEADLGKVIFLPKTVVAVPPGILHDSSAQKAIYEIMGETEGFSVGRYTITRDTEIKAYRFTQGRLHSLLVTEGEIIIISEKGEEVDRLKQGEERIIPASIGKYKIHVIEGPAVVYTQYRPLAGEGIDVPEPAVTSFEAPPFKKGRKITELKGVIEEAVYAYEIATVLEETGVSDIIKIHEESEPSPIGMRTHVLEVTSGKLAIEVEDEEPVVFEEGSVIRVSEEGIEDRKGTEIRFSKPEDILSYKLIKQGIAPVEIKVRYAKTETEQAVYLITRMLKWALAKELFEGKRIDFVLPKKVLGRFSRSKAEKWLNEIFGKDTVKIHSPYEPEAGLASATRKIRDGAIGILGATETAIETADRGDQVLRDFLGDMRILALPDIEGEVTDQSWFFVTAGTAVLQTLLDADAIEKGDAIALRMERLMSQLTHDRVRGSDLYYMLSYKEVLDKNKFNTEEEKVSLFVWMMNLAKKLGLKPIKPFDPRAKWEARLESLHAV